MTPWPLHDGPTADMAPKAAHLARAAAAGLPVPHGVVMPLDQVAQHADDPLLRALWASAPTIVRSALAFEDGTLHSGAGIGVSIPDVRDRAALLAAAAEIGAARADRHGSTDDVIVQLQIAAVARIVVACEPDGEYLEEYGDAIDAFGSGATPRYSGPLRAWPSPWAAATRVVVGAVRAAMPSAAHGLDVELVIDASGTVHLVQVRPLTAPLHPGWPAFVAAVADAGEAIPPAGVLVLVVEHNPAPLSFAHAWLVRHLAAARPRTGGLVPLAGWLYTRVLMRDLADHLPERGVRPHAILVRLRDELLPAARARHTAIAGASATATAAQIEPLFGEAIAAFVAMTDLYVDELVGARRHHRALVPDPVDPLCLRGRAEVVDVLPLAWDVAAPTLGGAAPGADNQPGPIPEDDDAAATLLREWDDHLFALGLAPLRAVYLRAGILTGLGDAIFELSPPECVAALAGVDHGPAIAARQRQRAHAATLSPPGRIVDGAPAGVPPRWLRGLPIGPPTHGPVAQRRDLAHLRDAPPGAGCVVIMPALTAPAAVVLHRLGLRAICCEHGGAMSHAALIARELGLSALLGCRGCTTIPDGTEVDVDTRRGVLRRHRAP